MSIDMEIQENQIQAEETTKEVKRKLPYGKKTELLKQLLTETGTEISHKDFKAQWKQKYPDVKPPSRSYFDQLMKAQLPAPATEKKPEQPETVDLLKEPTPEEIEKAEKLATMPVSELKKGLMSGKIGKNELIALFKIESKILKMTLDYEHDPETVEALAAVWEVPVEMWLSTLTKNDSNKVLIMALVVTLLAHAPIIPELIKKLKKPKKENP